MSGGITQLVAIGAQDAHIVGNPEVSFFRSTYKRHTNFAQTVERQVIQGNVSDNGMSTIRFERKGDMLGYVYLALSDGIQSHTPSEFSSVSWSDLIKSVQLLVGGQVIDEQDVNFSSNIAPTLFAQNESKSANNGSINPKDDYFYPFRFFFCENWQSALPLVALQYHDVELRIYWGPHGGSAASLVGSTIKWEAFANFTYLDTAERAEMANKPQNMLIYQVQKAVANGTSKVLDMSFNQPVKFLASSNKAGTTGTLFSPSNKVKLQLNGTDVADFKYASPHFTRVPLYYHVPYSDDNNDDIFLFPFCLDTSKLQPTGTLNFSRLDSARLISETDNINTDVYAVNYNILRIQNGMGGLMYAN
jgi:hypothetical protein